MHESERPKRYVAFVSDVHVGNQSRMGGHYVAGLNRRCRDTVQVLDDAVEHAAKDLRACAMVSLGDLTDESNPKPQILAAIQDAVKESVVMAGGMHFLVGNHDQESYAIGDHALGPLRSCGNVADRPQCVKLLGLDMLLVPFQQGPAKDWLPAAVIEAVKQSDGTSPRCLGIHLGISDDNTPGFLKDSHDSVPISLLRSLKDTHNLNAIIAGNWHKYKDFGDNIIQAGALVPNGFSDAGDANDYGSLILWDGQCCQRYTVPGPRFIKLDSVGWNEIKELQHLQSKGYPLYVRAQVSSEELHDASEALRGLGFLRDFEVVPSNVEAKAATRLAAKRAASFQTVEDSCVAYVSEMDLPSGVDRKEVLQKSLGFLKGTS